MSKKVIVTGATGQLGTDLVYLLNQSGYNVFGLSRKELDITKPEQVEKVFQQLQPDIILHSAAYTNVDEAERDPSESFQVNGFGTRNIAIASKNSGAKLIYISTDYVFDGTSQKPYEEQNEPNPINEYGKSKLLGEQFVKELHDKSFIVRTSWLFGMHGPNFVKTMLKLSKERKEVRVVRDQVGCPTYSLDLAEFLIRLMETNQYGIYHATNRGSCSWYEFATEIFKLTKSSVRVQPCLTEEFPRLAKRPSFSVLDNKSIREGGFKELQSWQQALKEYLVAIEGTKARIR